MSDIDTYVSLHGVRHISSPRPLIHPPRTENRIATIRVLHGELRKPRRVTDPAAVAPSPHLLYRARMDLRTLIVSLLLLALPNAAQEEDDDPFGLVSQVPS